MYAKTSGYIGAVKVDIGDHVKVGQELAVIDNPELQSELSAAQAMLRAKTEMAKASKAAVEQAQTMLRVAKSQLAGYDADAKLAETTLKRQQELFEAKASTDQQLDDARTREALARTQREVGEAKIAAAEADIRASEASAAVAEAQVGVAEAEAKRIEVLVAYTKITAPFDGVVSRRFVNRGELAQNGTTSRATPLFTIQKIDTVRVVCEVPESVIARLAADAPASIKVVGLGDRTIDAKVTRSSSSLNAETRTMRAEIHLPNTDEKLRAGMYAQVTLTLTPSVK